MKLLKPHWVHHDEKPIFSIDVHPGGLKFVTGGQGNDSGRVVIWNLLPVLSEKAEEDATIPKILCQMDNHLSCVNCVRWSQNGQMLASGSDDKLVMIWKLAKGASGVFGTGGITKNTENWRCISTLRGHAGDVLDLAWAPQDRWLASCSVDNTVIVWDVHALPSMIAVLKGHTGLVKGVTWDPVGKFLASQSDDRSVKIWKTSDWSCGNTITEPFEECGGTTHILRLSWSPDGQYLVSAHAMNGGGPTAQIIEREGWKCDKDFVGHRKAVTCVRFHNSILKRPAPKTNKAQQYCCLAVGSRDRSLSVWMTVLQRPLVVIHELFQDSVLDLSWGPDKYILLACSGDGTVACLQFTDKELGTPLSDDERNSLYQRIYGKCPSIDAHASPARNMIIENADLINILQEKPKPPTIGIDQPQKSTTQVMTLTTETTFQTKSVSQTPVKAINKQIETRTADGKRRITPMFIPLHQDVGEVNTVPELNSSSRGESNSISEKMATDAPTVALPSVKPISAQEKVHLDNRLTKTNTAPAKCSSVLKTSSTEEQIVHTPSDIKPMPARINLASQGKCSIQDYTKSSNNYRLQVQNNNVSTGYGPLCKVSCWATGKNESLWDIFIGSSVVNFCICAKYALLCSSDGTLRFLSVHDGTSVLPILKLPSAAVQCAFCPLGKLGGVISECGQLRIWSIEKQNIYLSSSCIDILKSGQIVQFTISENGVPFLLFSNGTSYSYSRSLECWMVLNSKDPVIRHGLQATVPKEFKHDLRTYPLMTVQSSLQGAGKTYVNLNCANWEATAKLTFIENQIKLCEAIESPKELKYWYSMLAYHLAISGTEKRIRLLLDELLGPAHQSRQNSQNRKILNIEKSELLDTVLNVFKTHPQWQRLYMEYTEQMRVLNSYSNRTL